MLKNFHMQIRTEHARTILIGKRNVKYVAIKMSRSIIVRYLYVTINNNNNSSYISLLA